MESILKTLQESPYTWAILSLITIVSLIIAIYSWVNGKKFKRLTYTKKTNKLISLKNVAVDSLHLFFNKEEIMDVSITRLAVWNSGNERIDSTDIVAKKPLTVGLVEGHETTSHILDCSIDYVTDETIFGDVDPSKIELMNDSYTIPFDYLAPSDGMIIQLVHTGSVSDLYLNCHIKGGQGFTEVNNDGFPKKQKDKTGWRSYFIVSNPLRYFTRTLLYSVISFFYVSSLLWAVKNRPKTVHAILFVTFLYYGLILFIFVLNAPNLFNSIKIPKKLKEKL